MMTVPYEVIELTADAIFADDDEAQLAVVTQSGEHQPLISVYVMAVGEEFLSEDEQDALFSLGTLAWKVLHDAGYQAEVTEDLLDEVEAAQFELIESFQEQPDDVFINYMDQLFHEHPQKDLLRFMFEDLTAQADDDMISDENSTVLFAILIVVVDCLLEAKKRAAKAS